MPSGTALFLDTTILIARLVHRKDIRSSIVDRLSGYDYVCTGLVAIKEFNGALLKDAYYLLKLCQSCNTVNDVMRRLEGLVPRQLRKFMRCFQMLGTATEEDDRSQLDHLRCLTLYLLKYGLKEIEESCDVLRQSSCAMGKTKVVAKPGKVDEFDFGPAKCSKTGNECGIVQFLLDNLEQLQTIQEYLKKLDSGKTDELKRAEEFVEEFLSDSGGIRSKEPCTTVGDLLIAIESQSIRDFYTINLAESQHFCKILKQKLILRPTSSSRQEEVYDFSR